MQLHDPSGNRLYLNAEERAAFLAVARTARREVRTLCETLHYTGCRISEALALTPSRIDLSGQVVVFESLKKRRRGVYRAVPVPGEYYLDTLDMVHALREVLRRNKRHSEKPLWTWTRQHAWMLIKGVMTEAEVPEGPHRTPKGLRHGYGIAAIGSGVPLNMLSKWMGHASLEVTAIYANATGSEEREIAERMWTS